MKRSGQSLVARMLLAAALGMLSGVAPLSAEDRSPFPDIQRILDAGILRVAMLAVDSSPMIMTDEAGNLTGSEPDLARDLGRKLGVDVEFIRTAETYDAVVDMVAEKKADVGVSFLSGGVDRAKRVLFSQPYIRQSWGVFYNRARFAELRRDTGAETLRDLEETAAASNLEIGVLEGSVYQNSLERDRAQDRLRTYPSLDEMMRAVREGTLFSALHGSLQIAYYMRTYPSTAIYVAVDPTIRRPSDIRIAVRPDAPQLLQWVNIYLSNHVGMLDAETLVDRYVEQQSAVE